MDITQALSSLQRSAIIQKIKEADTTPFDLIVIGGGITGAGIALDAAARGLKTLVLEMQDFGAGTSSRSTKLIHGGLRYLKQLEINLVREVGQERAILHKNAPHIVQPKKMLLPIVENGSLGKHSTALGLYVYDRLAGVEPDERRTMHSKEETAKLEPLLRKEILLGGGLYWEYQTDDARLVIEVLKTAIQMGGLAINYAEVIAYNYDKEGKAKGVRFIDHINHQVIDVAAKKIVNATGPWVDDLRRKDRSLKGKRLQLTKGVHLVVPYERLPLQQATYFDVQDGRMMFAIPRGEITYIGTTDTTYSSDIENPTASIEDVNYILDAVNYMLPDVQLTVADITSSWAGLRPLIHEDGKSPSELSRKDEIFYSKSGVISIAGGKLTGFRKMAERAVDVVEKELYKEEERAIKGSMTDSLVIGGGQFKSPKKIKQFIQQLHQQFAEQNITAQQIKALVYKYGHHTQSVLNIFESRQNNQQTTTQQLLLAELHYTIQEELVTNLSDFLIRRTGRLYFARPSIAPNLSLLHNELATVLSWTKEQKQTYLTEFQKEYELVVNFHQEEV